MNHLKKLTDLPLANKRVLVRLDLNLPRKQNGEYDLTRLKRSLSTLRYLITQQAKIIILAHNGQPKGKFMAELSLAPIVDILKVELGSKLAAETTVKFLPNLSPTAQQQVADLQPGEILLVENLRFHPEEKANDLEFAERIASLGDFYINEAFSCSHRVHASIVSIPKFLPSAVGLLLAEELETLHKHLDQPKRPVMAIVGGAKVSSKLEMLLALVKKVDILVIGGAMANTFLKANGHGVGRSMYEEKAVELAKMVATVAKEHGCELVLPHDVVVIVEQGHCHLEGIDLGNNSKLSPSLRADDKPGSTSTHRIAAVDQVAPNEIILDIGPSSVSALLSRLSKTSTVVWNGPLGLFERPPFDAGTSAVARAIANLTLNADLISIAGGGDIVAAINVNHLESGFTYISTGGGAFLKWLEGKTLPGVEAVQKSEASSRFVSTFKP